MDGCVLVRQARETEQKSVLFLTSLVERDDFKKKKKKHARGSTLVLKTKQMFMKVQLPFPSTFQSTKD